MTASTAMPPASRPSPSANLKRLDGDSKPSNIELVDEVYRKPSDLQIKHAEREKKKKKSAGGGLGLFGCFSSKPRAASAGAGPKNSKLAVKKQHHAAKEQAAAANTEGEDANASTRSVSKEANRANAIKVVQGLKMKEVEREREAEDKREMVEEAKYVVHELGPAAVSGALSHGQGYTPRGGGGNTPRGGPAHGGYTPRSRMAGGYTPRSGRNTPRNSTSYHGQVKGYTPLNYRITRGESKENSKSFASGGVSPCRSGVVATQSELMPVVNTNSKGKGKPLPPMPPTSGLKAKQHAGEKLVSQKGNINSSVRQINVEAEEFEDDGPASVEVVEPVDSVDGAVPDVTVHKCLPTAEEREAARSYAEREEEAYVNAMIATEQADVGAGVVPVVVVNDDALLQEVAAQEAESAVKPRERPCVAVSPSDGDSDAVEDEDVSRMIQMEAEDKADDAEAVAADNAEKAGLLPLAPVEAIFDVETVSHAELIAAEDDVDENSRSQDINAKYNAYSTDLFDSSFFDHELQKNRENMEKSMFNFIMNDVQVPKFDYIFDNIVGDSDEKEVPKEKEEEDSVAVEQASMANNGGDQTGKDSGKDEVEAAAAITVEEEDTVTKEVVAVDVEQVQIETAEVVETTEPVLKEEEVDVNFLRNLGAQYQASQLLQSPRTLAMPTLHHNKFEFKASQAPGNAEVVRRASITSNGAAGGLTMPAHNALMAASAVNLSNPTVGGSSSSTAPADSAPAQAPQLAHSGSEKAFFNFQPQLMMPGSNQAIGQPSASPIVGQFTPVGQFRTQVPDLKNVLRPLNTPQLSLGHGGVSMLGGGLPPLPPGAGAAPGAGAGGRFGMP